jgi:hypothetical protein
VGDDTLGSGFDGRMDAELRGGLRISHNVALSEASEEQIVSKFRANTTHLPPNGCARLERALLNDAPHGRALMQLALAALLGQQLAAKTQ